MSKRITIEFPFGGGIVDVNGWYSPAQQGRMYLANGDPGYPDEPSSFEIDGFSIYGIDLMTELNEMYVKDKYGNYVSYFDSISDKLHEIADEEWAAMNSDCYE